MKISRFFKWILQLLVVLAGIGFITFTLTYLSPGDPAELMLTAMGTTPTEEQVEKAREEMGLNDSFVKRYADWMKGTLRGDFGTSYYSNKPVLEELASKLPATLKLAVWSMVFMVVISVPVGILTAVYRNKWFDFIVRGISFAGISMPSFLVALILLYFLGLELQLFPIRPTSTSGNNLVLPVATLTFAMAVKYIRQVRNLVIEELSQEYVEGARARGLGEWTVLCKHVLPNVMLPLVTLMGLSFGSLLGGTALIEIIFSWPGLGKYAISSIMRRDYPVIQAYVLWLSFIYMAVNAIVDLSYHYLDPRLRKQGG